jgi:Putative porin
MKLLSRVRSLILFTALFALHAPVFAASNDDLADIRNQLRELTERVNRLEQENQTLKAQNQALQGGQQANSERKESKQSAENLPSNKAPSLADRVTLSADFRYRHEDTSDDTLNSSGIRTADRDRDRIRARLSAKLQATKDVTIGMGIATSEGGDPRTTNQTLGDEFTHKTIALDLAYVDWSFANWGHFIGGKMKQPFFRPGQSLFWDTDITPEGIALTFKHGVLFGTAYGFWLNEFSGPENTRTSDTMLYGGQIGARLPFGESNLVLAAHYYDLSAGQGRAPFYNNSSNGNTTIPLGVPPTQVLRYDYRVIDVSAEYNMHLGTLPMQLWADVAQNQDPGDLNDAWAIGAELGNASEARTWGAGVEYHKVEKDAIFGQFIDGDLGGGQTDIAGWVLRAAYAPMKNVSLNATYFLNERNVDMPNAAGQTDVDYRRFQLDLNTKF